MVTAGVALLCALVALSACGQAVSIAPTVAPEPPAVPTPVFLPTSTPEPPQPARAFTLDAAGVVRTWRPGEAVQAVSELPGEAYDVALSPDGLWAVYLLEGRVYVRELAGDAIYDVSPGGEPLPGEPLNGFRWSPDSTALLFDLGLAQDMANNTAATIYLVEMSPGIPTPGRPLADGLGPAWSPDGAQVAFAGPPYDPGTPWGGGAGGQLTLVDLDGGDPRPLGELLVYPEWQPILWSADGARIAAGAAVLSAEDGALAFGAPPNDGDTLAAFQWIDETGDRAGLWRAVRASLSREPGLFVEQDQYLLVGADGTSRLLAESPPVECPCNPIAAQLEAAWSPAGDALFTLGPLAGDEREGPRLISLAGGAPRDLPTPPDLLPLVPPRWSPDTGHILVTFGMPGVTEAWAYPPGGGEPARAAPGAALGWAP